MIKYTFTIETDSLDDLETYQQAHTNSYIVFELKHNFFRRFKYLEEKPKEFYEGVEHVLYELNKLIRDEQQQD